MRREGLMLKTTIVMMMVVAVVMMIIIMAVDMRMRLMSVEASARDHLIVFPERIEVTAHSAAEEGGVLVHVGGGDESSW